ncbi:MAG: DegT/DnrJ/EryC1/StrS family aminotransferase [Nitrospirae bacterium]|nr:DegT/DnrJ/EryC1/StrS family aminotransferase [Nitrospirota bacterium]
MKIEIAKPYLDEEEQEAVREVIAGGWISQGPKAAEFENIFADYVGTKYAIATTSCTTALHAALAVSGIGAGDEVIVPSLSFIATANSIVHCGATPVFVDIDPETCNVNLDSLEAAITKKTKAVMPVHQMGLPADIDSINAIAKRHSLVVIEDAACAIGSEYKGRRIGGSGNIACFSFHPRKVITTGEGGMITTNRLDIAERLRRFRHHGMSISDLERHRAGKVIIESYTEAGYNYRMTDMQAAMGITQMKKLPDILEKRRRIGAIYNDAFSRINSLRVPSVPEYVTLHNYQSYWLELLANSSVSRDELMQILLEKGISTRRGIMAIHKEQCYSSYHVSLPMTERITSNTIILPLYPSMTIGEQEYVIRCLRDILL